MSDACNVLRHLDLQVLQFCSRARERVKYYLYGATLTVTPISKLNFTICVFFGFWLGFFPSYSWYLTTWSAVDPLKFSLCQRKMLSFLSDKIDTIQQSLHYSMHSCCKRTIKTFPQGLICNFTVCLLILCDVPSCYVLCQFYYTNIWKQALGDPCRHS